ncbi:MAG: DUF1592 domain-containing protein [Polyangiaceae bacterium]
MRRVHTPVLLALAASAAIAGCIGNISDPVGKSPGTGSEAFAPPAPKLQRLLSRQYVGSVRELLGDAAALAATPPADTAINGFDAVGASQLNVGDEGVVAYEKSARAVARAAVHDPQSKIPAYLDCVASDAHDAACARSFIARFGHVAFRRPLEAAEIDALADIADLAATDYGTFEDGLEYAIAAMLEAPSFVYRAELGSSASYTGTDGKALSLRKLSGPELATRMSFFLLDATPSEAVLLAAEGGALDTDEGIRALAEELLDDPRARASVSALYDEVLGVRNVVDTTKVVKDSTLFPEFSPALASAMREETARLVEDIVWTRDADFRELLTADYTFVTPELAALYGVPNPAPDPSGWTKVSLPAAQRRAGFLGGGAYLSTYAHKSRTSPTLRGKFIRERLLCESINPPPNNVKQEFPPDSDAKTMKEKLAFHQSNPSCAACHALMDPVGLAFENFDPIGRFRLDENGQSIDATGTFEDDGQPAAPFTDGRALGALIASDPAFASCVVKNVFRHSLGHIETKGERRALDALAGSFEESGFRIRDWMIELVVSDAFRWVGEEP